MIAYLQSVKLASPQYRKGRRGHPGTGRKLTGAIAVHTAESILDNLGPDTGAENVADWMRRRLDPGSYHDLCDSDSFVHLVDYSNEAFHDGTGGNRYSLGLSFACRTTDWAKMSLRQKDAFVENGARRAAAMAQYVLDTEGIVIPAKRITAAEYRAGKAGFVSHAELDPGRRSDPGNKSHQFPWTQFLNRFAELTRHLGNKPTKPTTPNPSNGAAMSSQEAKDLKKELQAENATQNAVIAGLAKDSENTDAYLARIVVELNAKITALEAKVAAVEAKNATPTKK